MTLAPDIIGPITFLNGGLIYETKLAIFHYIPYGQITRISWEVDKLNKEKIAFRITSTAGQSGILEITLDQLKDLIDKLDTRFWKEKV